MRPIRAGVVVTLACVAALLGACSEDSPEPPPSPSTSSTSSTTETTEPVPEPPALPPEATTPDAAGAAAFVRHWFDLANYAYATGNTEPLKAVSEGDCDTCNNIMETIDEQYADGGRFRGGTISVEGAEAPAPDESGVLLVTTRYSQAAVTNVEADGSSSTTDPRPGTTVGFVIALVDSRWLAAGIGT